MMKYILLVFAASASSHRAPPREAPQPLAAVPATRLAAAAARAARELRRLVDAGSGTESRSMPCELGLAPSRAER
jgi:hypothetical protein